MGATAIAIASVSHGLQVSRDVYISLALSFSQKDTIRSLKRKKRKKVFFLIFPS